MFNSDLNPYIAMIQDHKDIITMIKRDEVPDPNKLINEDRPLIVDLGCGAGNFLRDYALIKPEYDFVGFELRFKRLVKGAIKFKKRNIKNIKLIQARAEDIGHWFPNNSIHEVNVNFPDPWPKKRHHKHRLISNEYLQLMNRLLKSSGKFVFKTDHKDYFQYAANLIRQQSFFTVKEYSEDLHNSSYNQNNIPTEFELLFKSKGCLVYYIRVEKE